MTVAIRVDDLHKSYGEFEAVRGISFEVAEGEVFAFLGPNGAGKTTTVEILEGYRKRSSGNIEVLGMDPALNKKEFKERVGIVLQESGIQGDFRVSELLELYGGYYPLPRDPKEVMSIVGLESKADSLAKTLSGGEQRRLDFAVALMGDPDLVFLDEPTTGFDPAARRNSWEVIRNLCDTGKTIFLTTHYMDEAQELADRIAVISGGLIVATGTPESLGGRDLAATEIRFSPLRTPPPDLDGAVVNVFNSEVVIQTATATVTLNRLTEWALSQGEELKGLTVKQPSLEDVYLQLVGEES